jgi:hypothetical protein
VEPSPYDVWASAEVVDLVKGAAIYNVALKYAFAINREVVIPPRSWRCWDQGPSQLSVIATSSPLPTRAG